MANPTPFGLSSEAMAQLRAVFARHPEVDEAILYGSRAKGNYKVGSDIDLTMKGAAIDFALLSTISDEIYALPLPYTVDLSIYSTIDNPELIEHIERVGTSFYKKGELRP